MEGGVRYADPDPATEQGGEGSVSSIHTTSDHGHHREGGSAPETPSSTRQLEQDVSQHGTVGSTIAVQGAYQTPYSFSVGAIPTDVGTREKKRTPAKIQSANVEGYYDDGAYGAGGHPETLPRPYPPQSKSFGYAPKEISRSMGTTTLPREDPASYAMETAMAKGDTGRQLRGDYRGGSMAHGMSRSLPKQSFFPMEDQDGLQYPSRSAVCLQEMPHKRVDAYYSPQLYRKGDYFAKVSSSSSFKPKRHDDRYYDQFMGEQAAPYNQQQQQLPYDEAEYQKQWRSAAGYPGDQRWVYDLPHQGQQYAVHMVQETGHSDVFREGGDTGIVKSSGDSSSKFAAANHEDAASMYVYVRDAQTGTDTPLPSSVAGTSPPILAPIDDVPEATKEASESSSSSSATSEEESSSESSVSSKSLDKEEEEDVAAAAALLPTPGNPPIHQKSLQEAIQQPMQQSMQQPMQQPMQHPAQQQMQYPVQQQMQQPLHHLVQRSMHQPMQQMVQQPPTAQEYADYQEAYQQYFQRQQQQAYQQAYQSTQQASIQQEQSSNLSLGQEKKRVYFARSPETSTEVPMRMPAEGASLRSFHSRSSVDVGNIETAGEDSRSLTSSSTNMVVPLLRPLLPRRANPPGKDKMEHLCLALNVILFSVLAGVVAAFIVQQVSHAI
ncbi:unnamed protein product [Ixodes hexagonus]